MSTVKENLIAAKQLLIDKGRVRTLFVGVNGCLCALGAVGAAVAADDFLESEDKWQFFGWYKDVFDPVIVEISAVVHALYRELPDEYQTADEAVDEEHGSVYFYNDTTPEDEVVLAWFDRAIEAADGPNDAPPVPLAVAA